MCSGDTEGPNINLPLLSTSHSITKIYIKPSHLRNSRIYLLLIFLLKVHTYMTTINCASRNLIIPECKPMDLLQTFYYYLIYILPGEPAHGDTNYEDKMLHQYP